MANINKIRVSGTTYNIEDTNATKTAEVSQAQYDALVAAGTVDSNTFYIITDAEYFDQSNYYTSAQTESAITQAVSGKQDTLISGTNIKTINNESILGSGNITIQGGGGGIDSGTVQTMIDESISGKTDTSAFTAHTGDSTIHVTSSEKSTWNAKSDFSGSYNDLTNKPSIPSKTSDLTNDSDFATSGYVNSAVSGKANSSDVYTKSQTSGATEIATALSGKQDTLSAGTNITIVDNVISAEGGGKAVAAGTNISITTGETADTINCTLPITANSSVFNTISVGEGSGGGSYNTLIGANARCDNNSGHNVFVIAKNGGNSATGSWVNGTQNVIIGCIKDGYLNFGMQSFNTSRSVVIGGGGISTDKDNSVAIGYLANVSGTTKTNINNQLTIDTSNQVHISNSANTSTYCLQEKIENTESALGGLKLVKLTQSEYDNLSTYDSNTLYVIIN